MYYLHRGTLGLIYRLANRLLLALRHLLSLTVCHIILNLMYYLHRGTLGLIYRLANRLPRNITVLHQRSSTNLDSGIVCKVFIVNQADFPVVLLTFLLLL